MNLSQQQMDVLEGKARDAIAQATRSQVELLTIAERVKARGRERQEQGLPFMGRGMNGPLPAPPPRMPRPKPKPLKPAAPEEIKRQQEITGEREEV